MMQPTANRITARINPTNSVIFPAASLAMDAKPLALWIMGNGDQLPISGFTYDVDPVAGPKDALLVDSLDSLDEKKPETEFDTLDTTHEVGVGVGFELVGSPPECVVANALGGVLKGVSLNGSEALAAPTVQGGSCCAVVTEVVEK